MWIAFALLTPFFWAIVHLLDSHCIEEVLEKPWMGIVTSAFASLLVFIPLPFLLFFFSWQLPSTSVILLALLAGVLIQISQAFYFKSLSYSEAGIVASYWNITPALLPIAGYLILRQTLELPQYAGIATLITTSVFFCLADNELLTRWRVFFLMLTASILQVGALMLEDYVYTQASYFVGFYLVVTGLIITGISPLLFRRAQIRFKSNLVRLKKSAVLFLLIETANLCALATSQKAISLGDPSLVAAVETSVPAYTFIMSLIFLLFGSKFGDAATYHKLHIKFILVIFMIIGVWLVS